ncbi:MAG TPA: Fe-S cluster assembly protein SufD [Longimicrobiales bacterium]
MDNTAIMPERMLTQLEADVLAERYSGEPDWLSDARSEGLLKYQDLPLPTTRLEEWRYTDPSKLKWDRVSLATRDTSDAPAAAAIGYAADIAFSARVVQSGARIVSIEVPTELIEQGVVVMDLADAAREHGDLVQKHLYQAAPASVDRFAAANAALWTAGVFVHVPAGVEIEAPIRIIRCIDEDAALAYFPRTLIVAEDNSNFGVVEEFVSPDFQNACFNCGVVEAFAGVGAKVQYVALQRWGHNVHHLGMQRTFAQRDSKLDTLVVNLGASVSRVDLAASLKGPGARSDMLGLYFAQGDQHFDHSTRQNHEVPHAVSDLLYKGALDGKGRSVFRGLIKVFPKAQRTDAYQTNNNLLLSRTAEATSLPNLEIEADDVRCSHAATVGQLDKEELFYIMSRGIARREAERLVVFGFFGDVLDRLPLPGVVRELRAAIAQKIAG